MPIRTTPRGQAPVGTPRFNLLRRAKPAYIKIFAMQKCLDAAACGEVG
ncbi:MAG: hypothetical protein FWD99_07115 [Oscillospiraceae bacterium]|nr:hypothetical protein [Oscillospiraceae bacterium]